MGQNSLALKEKTVFRVSDTDADISEQFGITQPVQKCGYMNKTATGLFNKINVITLVSLLFKHFMHVVVLVNRAFWRLKIFVKNALLHIFAIHGLVCNSSQCIYGCGFVEVKVSAEHNLTCNSPFAQWRSRTFGRSGRWSNLPPFRLRFWKLESLLKI